MCPTRTEDTKTTGGASGGTDDNPQDWKFPEPPAEASAQRRKFPWP